MSWAGRIIQEIKTSKLGQTALVYLGSSWAVLEAFTFFSQRYNWDPRIVDVFLTLLICGLPATLYLKWFQSSNTKTWKRITVYSLIFITAIIAVDKVWDRSSETEVLLAKSEVFERSIAVLPFANISQDANQEYFCDGTTEQVISSLARLKNMRVIARTSVMQYKKTSKTIAQIGKELNVTHVLETSVRKAGNQLRITAQLIEVQTETLLWTEDYDNKLVADIFQIQDDVATRIATSLKNKLVPEEKQRLLSEKSANPEGYEHYLRGEYLHKSYLQNFLEEDFLGAEQEFKKSILMDPNYATARAAFSNLYDTRSNFSVSPDQVTKYRLLADQLANEAFALNPGLPYAILVRAQNWLFGKHNLDSAYNYYSRAYEALPGSGLIISEFAGFYMTVGLYNKAIILLTRAKEIDPNMAYRYQTLGHIYFLNHEFAEAEDYAGKAIQMEPNSFLSHQVIFDINCNRKKLKEAQSELEKIAKISDSKMIVPLQARLLAEKGDKQKALALSRDLTVLLVLQMKEESLAELEKTENLSYILLRDSHFDFLRGDARFNKLEAKAKELYDERLNKYRLVTLEQ